MEENGDLAQLGERLPCTQEVVSSSLIVSMAVKVNSQHRKRGIESLLFM